MVDKEELRVVGRDVRLPFRRHGPLTAELSAWVMSSAVNGQNEKLSARLAGRARRRTASRPLAERWDKQFSYILLAFLFTEYLAALLLFPFNSRTCN